MANIPTNIRDIICINGFVNIINKLTHFDNRTGNNSLLDPILITDSTSILIVTQYTLTESLAIMMGRRG